MKMFKSIFPAIIVFGLILAACAMPPTEEMNRAQDAVIRAENDADAVKYAGNTLIRASDALTRMQSEADAKRYDAAKNYAAEAITNAERAIADGKTGAARAKDEATLLLNSLPGPLAETASALSAARQVKNINLDFEALSGDLDSARRTYGEAQQNLAANNYRDAIIKGQSVRSALSDINARISEAAVETSRKQ